MASNLEKYADSSMFEAAPLADEIKVTLLDMSRDPLASIAAACLMYEGTPVTNLDDITWEQKDHYAKQVQATHLKAPLEFVKFHFYIEGVDRAFTHQLVRQRTAVYAQESLRFGVTADMADRLAMPPSIAELPAHHPTRQMWDDWAIGTQNFYNYLIGNGVPAEDARAITPHAVRTRLHYSTDLRNLSDHAGNRLCTQAQFVWREVFTKIVEAIRTFSPEGADLVELPLFKPVCYQVGHCPFTASFDRGCTIRDRVQEGDWDNISDSEWMLDRKAAFQ